MEFTGKIIFTSERRSGKNDKGDWVVQEFVAESDGQIRERLVFSVYGQDKLDNFNIQLNQNYTISFNLLASQGKEGRWFQHNRAYNIVPK